MFAKKPEMAKEFAAHTPSIKNLPDKKPQGQPGYKKKRV